jgi:hypothetical protein
MVEFLKHPVVWLNQKFWSLKCLFHGHECVRPVEIYRKYVVVKNFKGSDLKKLRRCKPYNQVITDGKFKCAVCGCVFLGVIVKDNEKCSVYDRA